MMKSNIDPLLPENREEDRTKRKSQKDKKKYITMIFSVIIAVGLWIFVIGNENPTIKMTYSNIPIEYLNEDSLEEDGLVVAASQAPAVVKVTLQGKRRICWIWIPTMWRLPSTYRNIQKEIITLLWRCMRRIMSRWSVRGLRRLRLPWNLSYPVKSP